MSWVEEIIISEVQLYEDLINKFGKVQIAVAIEEYSELQRAISRIYQNRKDNDNLIDELADFLIVSGQIITYYKIWDDIKGTISPGGSEPWMLGLAMSSLVTVLYEEFIFESERVDAFDILLLLSDCLCEYESFVTKNELKSKVYEAFKLKVDKARRLIESA